MDRNESLAIVDVVPEKCLSCDGQCCRIYLDSIDGGTRDSQVMFEEWCESWDQEFENAGAKLHVQPLFDPLVVHMVGNEHLKRELISKGIDPDSCQYRGPKGCLLPRNFRPTVCRQYVCQDEQN